MNILVLNSGSSSLKYQLLNTENEDVLAEGVCERIGLNDSKMTYKANGEKRKYLHDMPSHKEAIDFVLNTLQGEHGVIESTDEINAIGHRVVHGGEKFNQSVLVNEEILKDIRDLSELAPLHNPANALGIEICMSLMPGKPNVAVFDTAFHQTLEAKAYMYALPYEDYSELNVRKYGFHGTSHKFIAGEVEKLLGKGKKVIICHLGNGASVCAVKDGVSIDTSMGLTPLQGLMMGTRSGDVDPSAIFYIMKKRGLTPEQMEERLNKKSGMLGIFEKSSDSRDIEDGIAAGDERAILTDDMYAYRVRSYIASYTAALEGVDAIVFTAGIGENAADLREKICTGFEYLGVEFDAETNKIRTGDIQEISKPESKVKVYKIPTNEEYMISKEVENLVK